VLFRSAFAVKQYNDNVISIKFSFAVKQIAFIISESNPPSK
jgi:hypothetical protein